MRGFRIESRHKRQTFELVLWCVVVIRCIGIAGAMSGSTTHGGDVDTHRLGEDQGHRAWLPSEVAPYSHIYGDGDSLVQAMVQQDSDLPLANWGDDNDLGGCVSYF